MVHEGHSKRVHGAFMRAPLGLTVVDPLGDNDLLLNIERDRLGSMRRARFTDSLALTQREYGPYGETYSNNGGDLLFGYTGHVLVNSGSDYPTYYAPYRMYSPDGARWTSKDPLGIVDGPNEYGRVRDNPVSLADPTGLLSCRDGCSIALQQCNNSVNAAYSQAMQVASHHLQSTLAAGLTMCALSCIPSGPGYAVCTAICAAGVNYQAWAVYYGESAYALRNQTLGLQNCTQDYANCLRTCPPPCPS